MKFYKPDLHAFTKAAPGAENKMIHAQNMTLAIWHMDKDAVLATHTHPQEQFACVISGAIQFNVGGKEVIVKAGELIEFAANEEHGGLALEDSIIYDFFAPRRDDFIEKFPTISAEEV